MHARLHILCGPLQTGSPNFSFHIQLLFLYCILFLLAAIPDFIPVLSSLVLKICDAGGGYVRFEMLLFRR